MLGKRLLKLIKRMRTSKPPKQIRFIDTCGNTLFLLPDGGSIIITAISGELNIKTCRYVTSDIAEIGGTERCLSAFAEECQRTGAAIEPEPMPETYQGYRIIRKMPVPDNIIALGRDMDNFWRYVTLERSQVRDNYDYPNYHTEGWKAHEDFIKRVLEWQHGKQPRVVVAHRLKDRGDHCET